MTPAEIRDLLARAAAVIREYDTDDEHGEILEELRQARATMAEIADDEQT